MTCQNYSFFDSRVMGEWEHLEMLLNPKSTLKTIRVRERRKAVAVDKERNPIFPIFKERERERKRVRESNR